MKDMHILHYRRQVLFKQFPSKVVRLFVKHRWDTASLLQPSSQFYRVPNRMCGKGSLVSRTSLHSYHHGGERIDFLVRKIGNLFYHRPSTLKHLQALVKTFTDLGIESIAKESHRHSNVDSIKCG